MQRRVLFVGVGVAVALVVATSMARPGDSREPRAPDVSRVIATVTTSDFRVVLTARQTGAGGPAPSAVVRVTTSRRVRGRWQQTAADRLRGTYFWNTATGPHAVCRLEIRTAGARPTFRPYVVQLLASPALGCGTAQRFHIATAGGSGTRVACSAASLPHGRAVQGLPPTVAPVPTGCARWRLPAPRADTRAASPSGS